MTNRDPGDEEQGPPTGRQFRHVYVGRGEPTDDSAQFRVRLREYIASDRCVGYSPALSLFALRLGLEFPTLEAAFQSDIRVVLSFITVVAHELVREWGASRQGGVGNPTYFQRRYKAFINFVGTALQEEHVAYRIDDSGGVHPLIDAEFQTNKSGAVAALEAPRYENVRTSLEKAFDKFTVAEPDTKSAVREAFDAAESLFKLILAPENPDLTSGTVQSELLPVINRAYEAAHRSTISAATRTCNSFAKWADACHPYRHGHGSEVPVPPPIELAIVLVSQGASFVRWLAYVDQTRGV
jgi:hypothetical protein